MGENEAEDPKAAPGAGTENGAAAEDDAVDLDTMSIEELEAIVTKAATEAAKAVVPKAEEKDPYEGQEPAVRAAHERLDKAEKELAERRERDVREQAAREEQGRMAEITAVAKEFKMTKKELMAVADYADAHPDKAAVADFRTLAVMQNPDLLLRSRKTDSPEAKDGAPAGGPAPAATIDVGSGGEAPPADFKPGPGHGFGDITNWALQHQRGQFITET